MTGCVKVYEVTAQGSQLAYQLSSGEWKGKHTMGVALSDSLPDSMLVICKNKPYVYQFPCHQATQEVKKYKIQGDTVNPTCIVANANTAIVKLHYNERTLVICRLPDFAHQSQMQINFDLYDISISTDKLLVMGRNEMVVKPLGKGQDLCKMQPLDGYEFRSMCLRNDFNAAEIYTACSQGGTGCVYRYKWDAGKSQYVNMGCVIDGLRLVGYRCLSVTSDGLLALREWVRSVQVYSLE